VQKNQNKVTLQTDSLSKYEKDNQELKYY